MGVFRSRRFVSQDAADKVPDVPPCISTLDLHRSLLGTDEAEKQHPPGPRAKLEGSSNVASTSGSSLSAADSKEIAGAPGTLAFPLLFWEEMMNAVSMVLANLYVWNQSQQILEHTMYAFDVEVIRWLSLLHCPCSASYHLTLMMRSRRPVDGLDRKTWTRVLDLGAVHVCAATFSWALSHGAWPRFAAANLLANVVCLYMLVKRMALGGFGGSQCELAEYWRLGVCVMAYPTAMLLREDVEGFVSGWILLVAMCCLQFAFPFGHALSRIPLALFIRTLLQSAAVA